MQKIANDTVDLHSRDESKQGGFVSSMKRLRKTTLHHLVSTVCTTPDIKTLSKIPQQHFTDPRERYSYHSIPSINNLWLPHGPSMVGKGTVQAINWASLHSALTM